MSLIRSFRLLAVAGCLAALSACAAPFNANVSRFQANLPAPQGQSFVVVSDDPKLDGGIEFGEYAKMVSAEMTAQGYTPAPSRQSADLVVSMAYGVDTGREKVYSTGPDPFWGGPYFGRGYYGRPVVFGRGGRRFVYGGYDPFLWGGGFGGGGVESFTVYTANLDVKIDRSGDGKRLFEGKAESRSRSNKLTYLVPNLVEAMFTNFPGNNGETVRISVAPEKK